jgi:hypothetical protein
MRLREDPRFRSVGPNVLEMLDDEVLDDLTEDDGIWFDYTFVEFLKTNYGRDSRSLIRLRYMQLIVRLLYPYSVCATGGIARSGLVRLKS